MCFFLYKLLFFYSFKENNYINIIKRQCGKYDKFGGKYDKIRGKNIVSGGYFLKTITLKSDRYKEHPPKPADF